MAAKAARRKQIRVEKEQERQRRSKEARMERKEKGEPKQTQMEKFQRESGPNFAKSGSSFQKAGLAPLTSRRRKLAQYEGMGEMFTLEQKEKKEKRMVAGLQAETEFEKYISIVQSGGGLKAVNNLKQRKESLEKSLAEDSQPLVRGHLAKTLAMMGGLDTGGVGKGGAEKCLAEWREQITGWTERKKWKEASTKLQLYQMKKKGKSLSESDWNAAVKCGVNKEELETWADNLDLDQPPYLFDLQDQQAVQLQVPMVQGQAFRDPGPAPVAEQEIEESETVPEWL